MKLVIHTYGRADKQVTLNNIPKAHHKNLWLAVQKREAYRYNYSNLIILPKEIKKLSPTRQYLVETCEEEQLLLMDDDLLFYKRLDDSVKLTKMGKTDFTKMFNMLSKWLKKEVHHVGISAREGNNRVADDFKLCTRAMRVLGYNVKTLVDNNFRFDRIPTKQDFDMTLQMLREGYANKVSYTYCQNQSGSNTEGGCSTYRTEAMMNSSAIKLAKLHHPFVKVVEKETKTAWGGGVRKDVLIQWKKAYASYAEEMI